MNVYQIFLGEDVTGLDFFELANEGFPGLCSEVADKLRAGIKKVQHPWKECIPFYRGNKFGFKNMNALKYFLFCVCGLTYDDIDELKIVGYNFYKLSYDSYTCGLSNTLCTVDNDEFISFERISHYDVDDDYYVPELTTATKQEIADCLERYYKNANNIYDLSRYQMLVGDALTK